MVIIQDYEPRFHSEVNQIFAEGILEHWPYAICIGLQNPIIWAFLAIIFLFGKICYSWILALILVTCCIGIYAFIVYYSYRFYVSDHLSTDMKDSHLNYWTKYPNVFFVALSESEQVVGCIAYQRKSPDTVEMNRCSVDSKSRGLGIGKKLVNALELHAKQQGFEYMYLETSIPQVDAMKMYEKLGFQFLRYLEQPVLDLVFGKSAKIYEKKL